MKLRVGQILEEIKIYPDDNREPAYFEVITVYDPPKHTLSGIPVYADIKDEYNNIIQYDKIYAIFIKPVESAWG